MTITPDEARKYAEQKFAKDVARMTGMIDAELKTKFDPEVKMITVEVDALPPRVKDQLVKNYEAAGWLVRVNRSGWIFNVR